MLSGSLFSPAAYEDKAVFQSLPSQGGVEADPGCQRIK
jgi:hypothetical protein